MSESVEPNKLIGQRTRRFLKKILIAFVVVALPVLFFCGYRLICQHKQNQIVAEIEAAGGSASLRTGTLETKIVGTMFQGLVAPFMNIDCVMFTKEMPPQNTIPDSLARLKQLDSLYLKGEWVTDKELAKVVANSKVATLHLHDTSITPQGMELLKQLPELKSLTLVNQEWTDAHIKPVTEIETLKDFAILSPISEPIQFTPDGLKGFADAGNLIDLGLEGLQSPADFFPAVAEISSIKKLSFGYHGYGFEPTTTEDIGAVNKVVLNSQDFKPLLSIPQLESLRINHLPINDEVVHEIVKIRALKFLVLESKGITTKSLEDLKNLQQLEHLAFIGPSQFPMQYVTSYRHPNPDIKIYW